MPLTLKLMDREIEMPFIEIVSNESECLSRFDKAVSEKLTTCDAEKFWSCKTDFETLVNSSFTSEITQHLLMGMLENPYSTDMRNQVNRTLLLQKETYSLVLSWNFAAEDNDQSLSTHGSHAMVSILSKAPVSVDYYDLTMQNMEVYEPGKKLNYSHQKTFQPKEILEIHGDKFIADIEPVPNLLMVTFIMEPLWNQIWSFDRKSLSSWSVSAASLGHTQLKIVLEIFKLFGAENAIEAVLKLCKHENHDVRWEAIRTLGMLRLDLAEERLQEAVNDTHPHVRESAKDTLAQLQIFKKGN
jgi:hypothetical protein